jgi:hypothetical protein
MGSARLDRVDLKGELPGMWIEPGVFLSCGRALSAACCVLFVVGMPFVFLLLRLPPNNKSIHVHFQNKKPIKTITQLALNDPGNLQINIRLVPFKIQ